MQLRALNMLYEIGISGKNHLIFIPTESRGLGIPTPIGVLGIDKLTGIGNVGDDTSKDDDSTTQASSNASAPAAMGSIIGETEKPQPQSDSQAKQQGKKTQKAAKSMPSKQDTDGDSGSGSDTVTLSKGQPK